MNDTEDNVWWKVIISKLFQLTEDHFSGLPSYAKNVIITIIITSFISVILIIVLGQGNVFSISNFIYTIIIVITISIIIQYIGWHHEPDRKLVSVCHEIQEHLRNISNPKYSEKYLGARNIIRFIEDIFGKIVNCTDNPRIRDDVKKKLDSLLHNLTEIIEKSKNVEELTKNWSEANLWLDKNGQYLVDGTILKISKQHTWLTKEKKTMLREDIFKHLDWVQDNLKNASNPEAEFKDLDIRSLDLSLIAEKVIYSDTFSYIRDEYFKIAKDLPPNAKTILIDFANAIIYEHDKDR